MMTVMMMMMSPRGCRPESCSPSCHVGWPCSQASRRTPEAEDNSSSSSAKQSLDSHEGGFCRYPSRLRSLRAHPAALLPARRNLCSAAAASPRSRPARTAPAGGPLWPRTGAAGAAEHPACSRRRPRASSSRRGTGSGSGGGRRRSLRRAGVLPGVPGPAAGRGPAGRAGPAALPARGEVSTAAASGREIQEEELRRFASRVAALLQGPELGAEAVDCLRRLHLTVAATKYPRK